MSFFNKIKSTDTLEKAIARKKGQSSISDKTRKKLQDKVNITRDERVHVNYLDARTAGTNDAVLSVLRRAMLVKTYAKVIACLEKNESPNDSMNYTVELLMENMIDHLKKKPKYQQSNINYFPSVSHFFEFLDKLKEGSGQGVIKMSLKGRLDNSHFCALEYRIVQGRKYVVFFESARLQGTTEAGTDHGVKLLRELSLKHFKSEMPTIAYLEMDVQRSASDCAIYALYTASHLHACVKYVDFVFDEIKKMPVNRTRTLGANICYLYWKHASNILHASSKFVTAPPSSLFKHMQSVTTMKTLTDELIEKHKADTTGKGSMADNYNAEQVSTL